MSLKLAVIGVGHLGKQHARIYHDMKDVVLSHIVDIDSGRAEATGHQYSTSVHTHYRDIIGHVDAVSIAVPTVSHHEIALEFLKRGIPVLVEKPLAKTIAHAQELVRAARASGAILQVGHVERFNPAVIAARQYVSAPRFIECHRLSPFKFRSADIDVVMDLMIHDIDIILHVVQSPLKRVDAVGVSLLFGREDIANARLEFENGSVANVTASRISDKTMRKLRIFSESAYISIDTLEKKAVVYRKSKDFPSTLKFSAVPTLEELASLPKNFYSVEELNVDEGEPLAHELASFVNAVRNKTEPEVPGEHGVLAMQVAERILGEIREHSWK